MTIKRRPCKRCGQNRAEKFFLSERGNLCDKCRKRRGQRGARSAHLKRTHGITIDEQEAILAAQGDVCAIEGIPRNTYDVDHDHKEEKRLIQTGLEPLEARRHSIRGLISRRTNRRGLPAFQDDPAKLRRAAEYLEHPPAKAILDGPI